MKQLSIGICDDDLTQIEYIKLLVRTWSKQKNFSVQIKEFMSAESFLFEYEDYNHFDMLLLDIEMGEMNGVDLAKKIRFRDEQVELVFITGFPDFTAEGYEVSALHYLLKPVKEDKFFEVLDRAVKKLAYREKPVLIEKTKFFPSEIIYIESMGHKSKIVTSEAEYELNITMNSLEELFESDLIKVHRSYLVGIRYIKTIGKNEVILDNRTMIPMSRRLYTEVNKAFIAYFRGDV